MLRMIPQTLFPLCLLLTVSLSSTFAASQDNATKPHALAGYDVDPDTGLRMERYRAPVPDDVPGGITLDTAAVHAHYRHRTLLFIDVYPPSGLGPDPLDGHWLTNEQRLSIPGSVWLPEVGRGTLQPDATDYFRRNLARLSNNQPGTPLVFFCTADCWQSWNAARRAIEWGYTAVHWYPLGSDGWQEAGHELAPVYPVNFLDDTTPRGDTANGNAFSEDNPVENKENGVESAAPATLRFPPSADIYLVDGDGNELRIGTAHFSVGKGNATGVAVELDSPAFTDQFLSMRPFRCLSDAAEWFCYLAYPYKLAGTITPGDLTELEYQLLFIWKSPRDFGIDAWNGVYYRLTLQEDGIISGELLQGDLNVLADPPEPYSHPIDLSEFIDDGADNRRYPGLVIRP